MAFGPAQQAEMELRKLFDEAKQQGKIPDCIPFKVLHQAKKDRQWEAFCVGPDNLRIGNICAISYNSNIGDYGR